MEVTRRILLRMLPAAACAAERKKPGKRKPGLAGIVEISARRSAEERLITIDGRVRNGGEKPLLGLTLIFEMLAPGGEEVTRQRGAVESDVLEPEEEAEFHWQVTDHARAVEVRVAAADRNDFEVRVDRPGPYAIE